MRDLRPGNLLLSEPLDGAEKRRSKATVAPLARLDFARRALSLSKGKVRSRSRFLA
jgi:hypothetical protein